MRCFCEECGGTGEVTCHGCDGRGESSADIETIKLDRHMKHYDELVELQEDAKRVRRQANRLIELKPHRAEAYDTQLRAILFIINGQADKVFERK